MPFFLPLSSRERSPKSPPLGQRLLFGGAMSVPVPGPEASLATTSSSELPRVLVRAVGTLGVFSAISPAEFPLPFARHLRSSPLHPPFPHVLGQAVTLSPSSESIAIALFYRISAWFHFFLLMPAC